MHNSVSKQASISEGSAQIKPAKSSPYPLPMVIGHRGAKEIAPENTIAAMRAAKAVGATCVEVDVMLTKDGIPVIHHDNTVDRCTTGKGHLSHLTWAELQELDAGSHFCPDFENERIPTLTELVLECRQLGLDLNVEIKHSNDSSVAVANEEEVLREIELATVTCSTLLSLNADPARIFLSSFSIAALEVCPSFLIHMLDRRCRTEIFAAVRAAHRDICCSACGSAICTLCDAALQMDFSPDLQQLASETNATNRWRRRCCRTSGGRTLSQ